MHGNKIEHQNWTNMISGAMPNSGDNDYTDTSGSHEFFIHL